MTKKQELLDYFTNTMTPFIFLKVNCEIIEPGNNNVLEIQDLASVKFKHKNDYMLSYINTSMSDDLIGYLPDTETQIKIHTWSTIDRDVCQYE